MPTLKITRKEMLELNSAMNAVGNLSGPRFVYVVAYNLSTLKREIRALQKASQPSEEYIEYDKQRVKLAEEFAEKDTKTGDAKKYRDGNAERFVIKNKVEFETAWEELKNKHKEAIDANDKQREVVDEMLEEEVELTLLGLKKEDLPEAITAKQLDGIFQLLVD